jgi:hypothetical protein
MERQSTQQLVAVLEVVVDVETIKTSIVIIELSTTSVVTMNIFMLVLNFFSYFL